MKFHDKLQALRKEKGWSQEKLAEHVGVSRQAVAKWEVGISCPDMENLMMLSSLFRVSIDKLVKSGEDELCMFDNNSSNPIVDERVIDFLCRAKQATYAGKGAETTSSRPASHDLIFSDNELTYLDTYVGGERFAGEEGLWQSGIPFWSMNYVGRVLGEGFSGDFLKESLLLVPKEYPYRGPLSYRNGEYAYHCVIHGEFEWFHGYEEIFYRDQKVYECMFHGGTVK